MKKIDVNYYCDHCKKEIDQRNGICINFMVDGAESQQLYITKVIDTKMITVYLNKDSRFCNEECLVAYIKTNLNPKEQNETKN